MATSSSKRRRRRSTGAGVAAPAGTAPSETSETAAQDIATPETLEDLNEPFDPGDAIEALWYELTRVEALAHAASQTLEAMPRGQDPAARRAAERIYVLVMATAESAEAALDVADAQLGRLNESLAASVRNKR